MLNPGPALGSVYPACLVCHPITQPEPTLEKENDAGEVEQIPMLKTFTVFNVQQIDGLPLTTETVSPEATFDPLPQAENLFRKSGANIIEKGQNAFFRPSTDEVWLPERHLFRMRLTSTLPVCMSWLTGAGVKNALTVK